MPSGSTMTKTSRCGCRPRRAIPAGCCRSSTLGSTCPGAIRSNWWGTDGHITVTDPWICGNARVQLVSRGNHRDIAIDPDGAFALTRTEADVYRIEIDTNSDAIAGGAELEFGRRDAMDQVAAIEAVRRSIETARAVQL